MNPVAQLPPRTGGHALEAEKRLVAGMLALGVTLADFEAAGVAAEDLQYPLHRKAWQIGRAKAGRRRDVTGLTVANAGRDGNWFSPSEAAAVEQLGDQHPMSRDEWHQLASDFRLQLHRGRTIAALEQQLQQLRTATFNPAKTAAALETTAHMLRRDTAPDEDATGDVVELLADWDENEKTQTSRLLATRLTKLDEEIGGMPWGLTVFAAAPGVGKTAIVDTMIRAQLEADPNIHLGFFGLEDGTSHIARRWMAHDVGMKLREVGWKQRTEEQRTASHSAGEYYKTLLTRLHVYRHDTITPHELVARVASYRRKYGIAAAYVDNLSEVDFKAGRHHHFEKEHEQQAELGRQLRNCALREHFAIGLITHTIGEIKIGDIPTPQDIAGGQALGRRTRLFCGLWTKGDAIRCTINKANELGPSGVTVEFVRHAEAGLVDPHAGRTVNVQQERAIERREKERERALEREAESEAKKERDAKRKEAREKAKAEAEAAKNPQAVLLEVPKS